VTEVELTLADLPIEPEFYGVPVDSLAGRFHRLAFAPTQEWYMPSGRWDSVRTVIESLLVQELRSAGFEVVDREAGVAICKHIADSLGGNFDRRKGRVDREREAVLRIQTLLTILDRYQPDGLIHWGLGGSRNDRTLFVAIEDRGGHGVYKHEVEAGVYVSPEEIADARSEYPAMLKSVLDPFTKAAFP
jgi:hypothetical protein